MAKAAGNSYSPYLYLPSQPPTLPRGLASRVASFPLPHGPVNACTCAFYLFIRQPHGSEVSPAARNTLDSARIPTASKLLICGLFQKGRVLAQDGDRRGPFQRFCERSVLRSWQDHSFGRGRFRRRCQPCRINSGIPTRSRYGARTPISTICGPSNPPTRLNSTASGVATPSVISKTLRQAPTTPLKRRCASNPTSTPPRKNSTKPENKAGIANSNSSGFQESMEPNRTRATRICRTQNPTPNSTGVFQ